MKTSPESEGLTGLFLKIWEHQGIIQGHQMAPMIPGILFCSLDICIIMRHHLQSIIIISTV